MLNYRLVLALFCGAVNAAPDANLPSPTVPPAPEDTARVSAFAAKLMGELSVKCAVRPVGDQAAFTSCRAALFGNESVLRASLKSFILWGRPPGGNINAALRDFRATHFGNDVFVGTYAPLWMWDGTYKIDYVARETVWRITAGAGFRNELDYGQFPYPFWHDAKKWTDYEDANTITLWVDPKEMKISQITFYKRADQSAVAQSNRRHVPTFDGNWMWVDANGRQQPSPTLFQGLYDPANPHLSGLDKSYRKLALAMRDAGCDGCHVPDNPDKAKRLVLLQTPLHAASEIERVLKQVRQDRMPLDEIGLEKYLLPPMKARLLADAEAFATVVQSARAWESAHAIMSPAYTRPE